MVDIKFPSMDLKGKTAIVTGAGQGLGFWIALGLAHAGADIVISEINPETGESAAEQIKNLGKRSLFIKTDVAKPDSIQSMVDRVIQEWGHIDILVNSAGVSTSRNKAKAEDMTPEEFDRVSSINLRGVYFCSQAAGKIMMKQKQGKIINIVSAAGFLVRPGVYNSVYATTKGGSIMLTKGLALEWAPYNINVNAVAPGFFPTPMSSRRLNDPKSQQSIMESTPMKRVGQPEDIMGPVIFLASDAANFITGVCLFVDGGRTAT
jgi:NAD(P)-dependent dehydrogenase (short-subunit alcohol dehydrogenase family)